MPNESATGRCQLAKMARELENQLRSNLPNIGGGAWIQHYDQLGSYFRSYYHYLEEALTYQELPQRKVFTEHSEHRIPARKENLGALLGLIGELASALESSIIDISKDIKERDDKIALLEKENQELKKRLDGINRIK